MLNLPSDDLAALSLRLWGSFLGRCARRFLSMEGIDRCIVLSSQCFTALIPLLILVSTLAPAGAEDIVSRTLITKFGLEGSAAAAVEQLFTTPEGATSSLSVFSAFLVVISGVSFTRRIQKMYRAAWDEPAAGVRSNLFAALGLLALLTEILVLYGVRSLVRHLPWDWLWMLPISATAGLVLWTSIPYLLLNRRVHWRRLLFGGAVSAVGTSVFGVATTIYMPPMVTKYTNEFGMFGITIALIGWLLAACGVLVASAAVGAEFDASRESWVVALKTRYALFDPAGDVPTVDPQAAASGLNSSDLLILFRVLVNWLILAAAVWAATAIVPGISVPGGFLTLLVVSLLLGLVNAVLGPLLHLVALPLTLLTLGTFALVVNGVLLAVTAGLTDQLDADGLGSCILGALVISVVTTVLELVLRPVVQVGKGPRTR
ncbi:phage holin family protein [Nocardioides panacis]|uniref:Phage holin family protein n=1 Tax=Nocardioides panacis TaxID=2849501 RepID=A0A975Y0X8_9ACTN|nr:YhjD/YihY/BrkB family envelope integrity protein [Nocardioides panacis]QWZ08794.1 phage holin family protein [Nocardioides panacis]